MIFLECRYHVDMRVTDYSLGLPNFNPNIEGLKLAEEMYVESVVRHTFLTRDNKFLKSTHFIR